MKALEVTLKNGKPVFSWCPDIEQGAIEQVVEMSKLPFIEHVSLMPDTHQGMNCPIGSVVACNGVIVPSFIGMDVGCGLGAFRTNLTLADIKGKEEVLHNAITRSVPMGFSHNTDKRRIEMEEKYGNKFLEQYPNEEETEWFI